MKRTRSAYYSRNDSFSRSFNAECAEEEGRLPRSRAAASLNLSTAAFDAGCREAGYRVTEWHHVAKYANRVYYYDVPVLAANPVFWSGAAAAYKTAAKRREVLARGEAAVRESAEREATEDREAHANYLASYRAQLHANWNAPAPVARHDTWVNWQRYMRRFYARTGAPYGDRDQLPQIANGDFATLEFRAAVRLTAGFAGANAQEYYRRMLEVAAAHNLPHALERIEEFLAAVTEQSRLKSQTSGRGVAQI